MCFEYIHQKQINSIAVTFFYNAELFAFFHFLLLQFVFVHSSSKREKSLKFTYITHKQMQLYSGEYDLDLSSKYWLFLHGFVQINDCLVSVSSWCFVFICLFLVQFGFIFKRARYEINDYPILDRFDKGLFIPSIFFDLWIHQYFLLEV